MAAGKRSIPWSVKVQHIYFDKQFLKSLGGNQLCTGHFCSCHLCVFKEVEVICSALVLLFFEHSSFPTLLWHQLSVLRRWWSKITRTKGQAVVPSGIIRLWWDKSDIKVRTKTLNIQNWHKNEEMSCLYYEFTQQ